MGKTLDCGYFRHLIRQEIRMIEFTPELEGEKKKKEKRIGSLELT